MEIVTEWFAPIQIPEHIGPYERDITSSELECVLRPEHRWFSWWNGEYWGVVEKTPLDAERSRDLVGFYQSLPWRGLAEMPRSK